MPKVSFAGGHLSRFCGMTEDAVREAIALEVYQAVIKEMLPTPTKSHYVFNLRDFARVHAGICMAKPDQIDSVGAISQHGIAEVGQQGASE